eukprot:TRINITY_DN2389_c0_g2_i1.p16 TRINITY_DN2389_c0_g2~~TRINITY_DN2389_c0_g2_i1.p16  ORF type:complete len:109 (-),score=1.07 TRINITY_DN2389_c0_g2_i1:653-979(-)
MLLLFFKNQKYMSSALALNVSNYQHFCYVAKSTPRVVFLDFFLVKLYLVKENQPKKVEQISLLKLLFLQTQLNLQNQKVVRTRSLQNLKILTYGWVTFALNQAVGVNV